MEFSPSSTTRRDPLPASERLQATSDLTRWGGDDFNNLAGHPATLITSTGQVYGVPLGQNGLGLTPSQLISGPNSYDRYQGSWILPRQERMSLLASGEGRISDDSSVFVDALLNRRRVTTLDPPLTTTLSVPADNPFNPFKGISTDPLTVLYGFGDDLGPIIVHSRVDSGQVAVGVNHD